MRRNWVEKIIEEVERKEDIRQIEDRLPIDMEGYYIGGRLVFDSRTAQMEDEDDLWN